MIFKTANVERIFKTLSMGNRRKEQTRGAVVGVPALAVLSGPALYWDWKHMHSEGQGRVESNGSSCVIYASSSVFFFYFSIILMLHKNKNVS